MSETPGPDARRPLPRVVYTHRDDALVPHLGRALRDRFDVVADVDVPMPPLSRLLVAGLTVRPTIERWGQRSVKSTLGHSARSRGVRERMGLVSSDYDVVFQTHALYRVDDPRTVIYVDCTYRQAAEHWPPWNPLRGRSLARWIERERRQYVEAAHVFAFCEATRVSLVEDYGVPPERVTVTGAGLDFTDLPPVHEPEVAAPVLLFVGHDFVRKGGPELLAAFARVRAEIPDARLRLVGAGCPPVEQPGVEVLGAVTGRQELSDIYASGTVFCLPSHFEPFGLVLLEAMAHGLPCIGTDSCGIPDIIEDGVTGTVVPADGDLVTTLSEALLALLRAPETARRQGAAGRQRVLEQFLWSHVTERMQPVFEDLARRRAPDGTPVRRPDLPAVQPGTQSVTRPYAVSPHHAPGGTR